MELTCESKQGETFKMCLKDINTVLATVIWKNTNNVWNREKHGQRRAVWFGDI